MGGGGGRIPAFTMRAASLLADPEEFFSANSTANRSAVCRRFATARASASWVSISSGLNSADGVSASKCGGPLWPTSRTGWSVSTASVAQQENYRKSSFRLAFRICVNAAWAAARRLWSHRPRGRQYRRDRSLRRDRFSGAPRGVSQIMDWATASPYPWGYGWAELERLWRASGVPGRIQDRAALRRRLRHRAAPVCRAHRPSPGRSRISRHARGHPAALRLAGRQP